MYDPIKRTERVSIRFRPHEREEVEEAAELERRTLSEWARRVLTDAAHRRLARSGAEDE